MLRIVSAQRIDDNPEELNDPNLTTPTNEDLPVVTPENVGQYVEPEEDTEDIQTEPPVSTETPVQPFEPQVEEQPYAPEVIEDDTSIIQRAIQEQQCVLFEYTTRKGRYAGTRICEIYGQYVAGTGNSLIVTFDRTANGIRAFLINNIHAGTLKFLPGDFYHFEKDKFVFSPK